MLARFFFLLLFRKTYRKSGILSHYHSMIFAKEKPPHINDMRGFRLYVKAPEADRCPFHAVTQADLDDGLHIT